MGFFTNWTQEQVEAHNAKVFAKKAKDHISELPLAPLLKPLPREVKLALSESTDVQKLNKLEKSFYLLLKVCNHAGVWVQAIQLKLADDCRYLPDFIVLTQEGKLIAYETKGHRWAKNMIKLRIAARLYPFIQFILVSKETGLWVYEEIKP